MADDLATLTKPHYSVTQLSMYERCGEQYRQVYIEKNPQAPGISLIIGRSVHAVAEYDFRQKITTRTDLPLDEILEFAAFTYEAETDAHDIFIPPDAGAPKQVIGKGKDSTVSLSALHAKEQAPAYQPTLVEERFVIDLGERGLMGVIDLVDDAKRVIDIKTTGKKKNQAEADRSLQLTCYAAGHKAITGELPAEVGLDVLIDKKTPERQYLSSQRGPGDFIALAKRLDQMDKGVKAGVFQPAPEGAWWCSARFCGFYATCPYVKRGV